MCVVIKHVYHMTRMIFRGLDTVWGGAGAGSRGADVVEFGKKEKIKRIHRDVNYLNL